MFSFVSLFTAECLYLLFAYAVGRRQVGSLPGCLVGDFSREVKQSEI